MGALNMLVCVSGGLLHISGGWSMSLVKAGGHCQGWRCMGGDWEAQLGAGRLREWWLGHGLGQGHKRGLGWADGQVGG